MDPADPRPDRLVVELAGGGFAPLDWSPDDRTILLHQAVSVNESYLWLADVATGVKTLLTTPGTDTVAYAGGGAQFSRDGKGIYLTTDQGSEVRRLAFLELLGKRYRFLSDRLPWDVDEFALSPDRSEEHTSELQSPCNLVCRLLLEKKKSCQQQPID